MENAPEYSMRHNLLFLNHTLSAKWKLNNFINVRSNDMGNGNIHEDLM